jgi:hypothetical protein
VDGPDSGAAVPPPGEGTESAEPAEAEPAEGSSASPGGVVDLTAVGARHGSPAHGAPTHAVPPTPSPPTVASATAEPGTEWLWLLHDDAAPAPDALEQLLAAVETGPSVGIAGCKQVAWDDDQRLLDVGFTTSRFGVLVTGVDRYEVDQGQHDDRCDVLAVSSAGMLIRRDLWRRLGGFDPALAHARDDLELCRRARLAGHRVIVVPTAVVAHAAGSALGVRTGEPGRRGSWLRADRRDTLHLRYAATPWLLLPLAIVLSAVGAVLRAVARMLLRQPGKALDELLAWPMVSFRPRGWLGTRRRVEAVRTVPRRTLRPLLSTRRQLWRHRRDIVAVWAGRSLPPPPDADQVVRPVGARRAGRADLAARSGSGRASTTVPEPSVAGGSPETGSRRGLATGNAVNLTETVGVGQGAHTAGAAGDRSGTGDRAMARTMAGTPRAAAAHPVVSGRRTAAGIAEGEEVVAVVTPGNRPKGRSEAASAGSRRARRRADAARSGGVGGGVGELSPRLDSVAVAGGAAGVQAAGSQAAGAQAAVGVALGRRGAWSVLLAGAPAALIAGAAAVVALRRLLSSAGVTVGPSLLPVPDTAAALWHAASSSWRAVGLGAPGVADPFTAVLAGLAVLFGGSPGRAVDALLITGLPLAAVTAWIAAGRVTRAQGVRMWAALAWAANPPMLAAVAGGRPATVLAEVLLPLVALTLARAVGAVRFGRPERSGEVAPRGSLAAAAMSGILLTLLLAAAPSLVAPAVFAVLVLLAVAPARRGLLLVSAAVPAVVLLPWWLVVRSDPRLLVADPGMPAQGSGATPNPWWHLLLLPGEPSDTFGGAAHSLGRLFGGAVPVSVCTVLVAAAAGGPVVVLGLGGLLRRRRAGTAALAAWLVALAGLGTALAAERMDVGATVGGDTVRGWAGPGLSLCALGVLLAAVLAGEGATGALRHQRFGAGHLVTGLVAGLSLLAATGVLAGWAWQGWAAPGAVSSADPTAPGAGSPTAAIALSHGAPAVTRTDPEVLPGVAAAEAQGPAATRTLVLRVDGSGIRWSLLRDSGPRTGDDSAALAASRLRAGTPGADADIVLPVVGSLLSDSGQDVRPRLADLDIGSVLLLPPADESTALALDSSPGLVRSLTVGGAVLWRVELDSTGNAPSRPSLVRVLSADRAPLAAVASSGAEVDTTLDAGESGRLLVLAERADARWQATLDGHRLTPVTYQGWAQAFQLPAGGGRLVVRHVDRVASTLDPVRVGAGALALLLAIPLPKWRRRVALPPPRRSRPVRRGTVGSESLRTGTAPPRIFDEDYPPPEDEEAHRSLPPTTGSHRLADLFRSRQAEAGSTGGVPVAEPGTGAGAEIADGASAAATVAGLAAGTGPVPGQAGRSRERDPLVDTWIGDWDTTGSLPIYSVIAGEHPEADQEIGLPEGPAAEVTVAAEPVERLPDGAEVVEGELDDEPDEPGTRAMTAEQVDEVDHEVVPSEPFVEEPVSAEPAAGQEVPGVGAELEPGAESGPEPEATGEVPVPSAWEGAASQDAPPPSLAPEPVVRRRSGVHDEPFGGHPVADVEAEDESLHRPDGVPADDVPADDVPADDAPAGTQGDPAGTQGDPAGTQGDPAGTQGDPAGTQGDPAGTQGGQDGDPEADELQPFPVQDDADLDFEPYRPDPNRPVYGQQWSDE